MKHRIAILTQKGSLSKGLENSTKINIFEFDDNEMVGCENIILNEVNEIQFAFMMVTKNVNIVYVDSISTTFKNLLWIIGIKVKCKDELSNDAFIEHFAFV